MRERVDRKRCVPYDHGRHGESPQEKLKPFVPSAGEKRSSSAPAAYNAAAKKPVRRRRTGPATELAKACEIRHELELGREVGAREEPPHVAPQEAVLARRVRIGGPIGVRVVVAMVRGPPQRPALHGGRAQQRKQTLQSARRLERAVREIAVVERRHGEHAQGVEPDGRRDGHGADACPRCGERGRVQADEGHDADPIDAVGLVGRDSG